MNKKIENKTREQIAKFLPDAIAKALTSYHQFAERDMDSHNAKSFSDHHKACKVAIAHIELLIKLAGHAGLPDAKADDHNNQIVLAALLQEAQEDLEEYKDKEDQ